MDTISTPYTPPRPHITKRAFWARFPVPNMIAMRAVLISGTPILVAATLRTFEVDVSESPYVDLTLDRLTTAMGILTGETIPATVEFDGQTLPLRLTVEQAQAIQSLIIDEREYWSPA